MNHRIGNLLCISLLALSITVLTAPKAVSIDLKPHPLYGESILINSAELMTCWTTNTDQELALGLFNYESELPEMPWTGNETLNGGAILGSRHFQQMDVAHGDFDGDGDDDIIAVYGHPLSSVHQQEIRLVITRVDSVSLDWAETSMVIRDTMSMAPSEANSPSNIRLRAGNLKMPAADDKDETIDGRKEEFVLGTRLDGGELRIEVFELNDQGMPVILASAMVEILDDDMVRSARFDITTSDFDGDGVDEIVIAGVRRDVGSLAQHFIHIYSVDSSAGALLHKCSEVYLEYDQLRVYPDTNWWRSNHQTTQIAVATGDLSSNDVRDEIVVAWNRFYGEWSYEGWPNYDWGYYVRNQAWLTTLGVHIDESGVWTLNQEFPNTHLGQVDWWVTENAGSPNDRGMTGTALGLAVADLDIDGTDEVIISGSNKLRVYRAHDSTFLQQVGSDVGIPYLWCDPSSRVLQAANLDAVNDDAQLNPEIVLLNRASGSDGYRSIMVWGTVLDAENKLTSIEATYGLALPDVPYATSSRKYSMAGDAGIYFADVDGDGVRLGPPSYSELIDSSQALVVLNTPPIHFDLLGETPHDVSGCFPVHDCDCFESAYSSENVTETTLNVESHSDWGVGSSLNTDHEFLGIQVKTSVTARYDEHFEKATNSAETYSQTSNYSTGTWPRFKVMRSDMRVWEYPLYVRGEFIDYFAVMRPLDPTLQAGWSSYTTFTGPDNPITTDPGNIFSYRRDVPTEDAWEVTDSWYDAYYEVGPAKECDTEEMTWSDAVENVETNSWEAGGEVSASVEWGGVEVEVNGNYKQGELSTVGTSVTEDISVAWSYGNLGLGYESAAYKVKPFVYRSSSGALVLDYAAEPIWVQGEGSFWETHYGSEPDPAFTLPYRFYENHGWDFEMRQFKSTDLRVSPFQADHGDTVQIRAVVHNFSLVPFDQGAEVRFYVSDPGLSYTIPISDISGQSVWVTSELAQQETDTLTVNWIVDGTFPTNPRIYAVIDQEDLMTEVHDDNNKAWVRFYSEGNGASPVEDEIPLGDLILRQNAPNPFNPLTKITFNMPRTGQATMKVYDVAGRLVKTLLDETVQAGLHECIWDGRDRDDSRVASGVYLYRLETPVSTAVKRMVLLK